MNQPPTTILDLDVVSTRHHLIVDPAACGTCWRLAADGKTPEHPECARRATLLPAPDAPDYEALADLIDEQKAALPARFHTPVWEGNAVPNSWVCAVCWGDGWVTRWPCEPAVKHGGEVFTPEHQAERARQDVADLLADVDRLRAELEQTRQQIAAVLALNTSTYEEVIEMEPGQYQQAVGYDGAVVDIQRMLRPAARPSA